MWKSQNSSQYIRQKKLLRRHHWRHTIVSDTSYCADHNIGGIKCSKAAWLHVGLWDGMAYAWEGPRLVVIFELYKLDGIVASALQKTTRNQYYSSLIARLLWRLNYPINILAPFRATVLPEKIQGDRIRFIAFTDHKQNNPTQLYARPFLQGMEASRAWALLGPKSPPI